MTLVPFSFIRFVQGYIMLGLAVKYFLEKIKKTAV